MFPSPPPPPPRLLPRWKHDVFISFRGKDLRRTFIAHLFSALEQASIVCFKDNAREDIGEEIKSKLFKAIGRARIALIVFSRNYADSKWCMNELVEILECRKRFRNHGHLVIPIFHEERDGGQIQKWREALTETKQLTGFDLRNDAGQDERRLVDIIVEYLVEKIRETRPLYFVKKAIGLEFLVDEVISLIRKDQEEDVRIIGICGVKGIGKTMAAAVIRDRIHRDFECSIFLDKIGEADQNNIVGLLGLQQKLLHDIIKVNGWRMYGDIQTNINEINSNMCHKRVLLVLDNVTRKEQINYFGAGEREMLCPGSRILITTRDQNLLKDLKVDNKYIVKGLDPNEAFRLFCRHALKREEPQEGYEELSKSLSHYAGGHPLSLEGFGSFLNDKSKDQWHEILEKLMRSPYLDSLSRSFQSVGPYGGQGGDAFDDGTHLGVRQISLYGRSVINFITVDYDQNGCLLVKLDHPSEYLISISGHIDVCDGHDVVRSLKIHSNKKTYGPFGCERGRPFDLSHSGGRIIGFHGKCSSHLDSIGAHFGPISHAYPFDVVGPFGGDSGIDIWDNGKYTDVRQIVIGFNLAITSISILYDEHGHPVGPFTHGTSAGAKTYTIKLDHASEYLTSISGYTEEVSGLTILQSLTIHTNKMDYGPIGTDDKGRHFSFPHISGKIVGFHGSCNGPCLESIGAFYQPIPHIYPFKVFGAFWRYIDIKRIVVSYGFFIYSIDIYYLNMDGSIRSTSHGRKRGPHIYEVKLDYPDEFITSISGFFSTTVISSLTIRTNKRIWGPIGEEEQNYFSLPLEAGKVIGLFGRSGNYLESIGAQLELYSNKLYPFKSVGLFGSSSGSCLDDGNKHTNVRKIIIEFETSKGPYIQSITFQYEEENKELSQSKTHGGIDGNDGINGDKFHIIRTIHTIIIHDLNEYLTSISGYIFERGFTSLTFQTNKKTIGPIGDEMGMHFSSPATGGKVVGFYGRSGEHLEAIGAYFEPISHLYPIKSIGPFGGLGGCAWDDGKFNGVREIEVMHDNVIHYIKFVYDKNGEQVCSVMHGHQTGGVKAMVTKVRLDYPREYLTSISGYKQEDCHNNIDNSIIQSLTFHSNRGRHGPFGKEMGKYFWYPSTGSKIIGFYGRCGETLNSIGAHAEPIPHIRPFKTIGPFGGSGGTAWDDGVHTDVRGFRIFATDVIYSIGIMYDNNGSSVLCSLHGKTGNLIHGEVFLDYPKERLVSISGCVNGNGNTPHTVIHNLKIHTTKTTYGPFGWSKDTLGMEFHIPSTSDGGRIVGFFGRTGLHLNSIGARLEPY
ncbi:hypothetical protein BT93_G0518 [Corymbia citriodora subsp. variegata]|nr:hypothetical protein BT93_G0518 [Corymbia citriodora subsp. variegata]